MPKSNPPTPERRRHPIRDSCVVSHGGKSNAPTDVKRGKLFRRGKRSCANLGDVVTMETGHAGNTIAVGFESLRPFNVSNYKSIQTNTVVGAAFEPPPGS